MTVAPEMLAVVAGMAAVTYLLRAVPLLLLARTPAHPGSFAEYLRLAAPAVLIALAAVGVALSQPAGGGPPELTLGIEAMAVLGASAIVAVRRNLLAGIGVAVAITAAARLSGVG
jgi:branched-subunit amino acid transport protein